MKKCLSCLVLAAAMLLPTTVTAHDFSVDGIYYLKNGSNATVTYKGTDTYSRAYSGDVVIPETVSFEGDTYTVTGIGKKAFYYCGGLKSVTIPSSVTSIGEEAFYNCTGITSMSIPNTVNTLGQGAFNSCSKMASITLSNTLTSIPERAFYNCPALTSIDIPSSVTSIEGYAFFYCKGLTNVEIPNTVNSIGRDAFCNCSNLTSVTLGSSVTSIATEVFFGCYGLTNVTSLNPEAIALPDEAFVTYETATLYVPAGSYESYNTTAAWNKFSQIVELYPTAVDEVNSSKTVASTRYYNLAGQEIREAKGICIEMNTYTDGTTNAVKVMK